MPVPKPVAATSFRIAVPNAACVPASSGAGSRWPCSTGYGPGTTVLAVTFSKTTSPSRTSASTLNSGPRSRSSARKRQVSSRSGTCSYSAADEVRSHASAAAASSTESSSCTPTLACRFAGLTTTGPPPANSRMSAGPCTSRQRGLRTPPAPETSRSRTLSRSACAAASVAPGSPSFSASAAVAGTAYSRPGTTAATGRVAVSSAARSRASADCW